MQCILAGRSLHAPPVRHTFLTVVQHVLKSSSVNPWSWLCFSKVTFGCLRCFLVLCNLGLTCQLVFLKRNYGARWWWHTPLVPGLGRRHTELSRPTWSKEQVSGQPGLYRSAEKPCLRKEKLWSACWLCHLCFTSSLRVSRHRGCTPG